ncbi:transmembrane protein 242 isoform X1 [Takifugu rubripes]|uniref:transmembrane protein 242 isoform X1 n=1 Tax=Takifugu rubripes TaxID=31033 RepID=UPI001145BF3D|nr:transmembrane protein 242 isoform X1 [Takifugu rubripes]
MTIASENTLTNEVEKKNEQQHELQTLKGAVFLATVASAGMMAGFGSTLALAKKRSPEWFNKGFLVTTAAPETGASLALRALGWGSLLSCCGVGMLSFTLWKILGVHNSQRRQRVLLDLDVTNGILCSSRSDYIHRRLWKICTFFVNKD